MNKNLFFFGLILSASGLISPPVALAAGLAYGFTMQHPYHLDAKKLTKVLLQASVVGLGFGMNLQQVVHAGRSGVVYTAVGISTTLLIGWSIGRLLKNQPTASFLISAGTAICGGSAIAALAPITNASEEETALALGVIFTLNSIALLVFPPIGHALHLSQTQFGLWSALAIHDTSSVVGATSRYGSAALAVGTTVKLARALWIVPVSFAAAVFTRSKAKIHWPWFIALFLGASVANTMLPGLHTAFAAAYHLGIVGLTATLFLIGTGLSWQTVRTVGVRPMLQGVLLWVVVGSASLALIWVGLVRL